VDADTLPTGTTWTRFTFDTPYPLVDDKKYAIVVGTSLNEIGDKLEWGQDTAAGYAGGVKAISSDSGATWTQSPTRDCVFRTRSAGGERQTFETANSQQATYIPYYIAQTFTCGNTDYTIVSVELRLRKTTESPPGTVTVSIRGVEGEAYPPNKATNPSPADTDTVDFSGLTLAWSDGGGADTFNVYVGPVGDLSLISSAQAGTTKVVNIGDVPWGEDVYWRIDSTNAQGTTTGDTWSFTTLPGKATVPVPTDGQEDLLIAGKDRLRVLSWTAPVGEAPDYKVYFRASGGAWILQETITDDSTSHTLSSTVLDALGYYSIYEWRIDSVGYGGTTTGDTWTFITQPSSQYTDYTRRSDYNEDQVWNPGIGWDDINDFEYTGGGRFKGRVLVIGHKVIYFGDL
jgi:hypothetical protein